MATYNVTLLEEQVSVTIAEKEAVAVSIKERGVITVNIKDGGPRGLQGLPGLDWKGDWVNTTPYITNDAVYHSGSSYVCIVGNTSQTPFEGSSFWDIAAKKGEGAVPRGPWDSVPTYNVDELVTFDGSSYRCILQHTNQSPPNATYWELFVSKGDKGEAGTGVIWRGNWDSGTNYVVNDGVFVNGSSYVCNAANLNQQPPNASYWDLFAAGVNPTGSWSSGYSYKERDLAEEAGTVYICNADHINQVPPNASYWDLFSSKGDTGPTGNEILRGTADPTTEGKDGDCFINETSRVLFVNKGSPTPGSWTGTVQIPLAANPNGARFTTSGNTQNPNAATAIAIEWNNEVRKDGGVTHSNGTNPSRFGPDTDKGGRYELFVALNFNNPSAARINLNLWLRKNGTTSLKAEGQTFGGYNRNNNPSLTSTTWFHWEGVLLDTDYLEVMSEQGDVAGTVSIMDDSFLNFKQTTLLENQASGGSGFGWGPWIDLVMNTTNAWTDADKNAQYRLSDDGLEVELRGLVKRTGSIASRATTLPVGARPASGTNTPAFITANKSTLGTVYAYVTTAGEVWFSGYSINNILELGGIRFQTDDPDS